MNALDLIPHDELSDFNQETLEARAFVSRWLEVLFPLMATKNRVAQFAVVAKAMGCTTSKVKRMYYNLVNSGWRGIIDRRRFPEPRRATLPPAFIDYWKGLQESHQRGDTTRACHRRALGQLDRWIATHDPQYTIPGYDAPPQLSSICSDANRRVPEGWSYSNLITIKSRAVNLAARRHGAKKQSQYLPNLYTTRAGLRWLERIFLDDQEYDNKVVLPGMNDRAMRPMGFNALEHSTAAFIDYEIKLQHYNVETKKKEQLKQRDYVWMVIGMLQKVGYRNDAIGTTLIQEHGTASGYAHRDAYDDRSFDELLHHVTGGHVFADRSGLFNKPLFQDMYFRPQSAGNFKFKSPLEGIFKLVRTSAAALPFQTGLDYNNQPEQNYGLDRYCTKLLKLYDQLPPEKRELLQYPALTFHEFTGLMRDIYQRINERRDHKLEGWEACNFYKPEWSLDGESWQGREALEKMLPEHRAFIQEAAQNRSLPMSPSEAVAISRDREKGNITRLHESVVPTLIPFDWTIGVKVTKNGEIHLKDRELGPETLKYLARLTTPNGRYENLLPGEEFRAYLNPYRPGRLLLADDTGRFVGGVDAIHIPVAGRKGEIYNQLGKINQYKMEVSAPMQRRAATVAEETQAMLEHNAKIAAEADAEIECSEIAEHYDKPTFEHDPDDITEDVDMSQFSGIFSAKNTIDEDQ